MITGETLISEVLRQMPAAREVFARHGMGGCIGCMAAASETVAAGARMHEADVGRLLAELNAREEDIEA
jgi:hybrid cluster-associated redox disulfide protein